MVLFLGPLVVHTQILRGLRNKLNSQSSRLWRSMILKFLYVPSGKRFENSSYKQVVKLIFKT
ncbi:hypothetical protein Patl1_36825 [Pistacia atlantica]|nr:hypothetical protein Patl1_36825 [Pistacia atlantica]